jgi:hypothetical protein
VHRIYGDFSRLDHRLSTAFFRNQSWQFIEVDGAMRAKALA